jgi:4a-hydroxytetrahydrobiopterin dehydratase
LNSLNNKKLRTSRNKQFNKKKTMMIKLSETAIASKLEKLLEWEYYDNALHTDFEFDNFKDCMSAMNRIAFECEALNHHPEWTNIYNTLDITLTTHDADGVTDLDFKLAAAINKIVEVEEVEEE